MEELFFSGVFRVCRHDFLFLYQYERKEDQERVFRQALKGMHLLHSHKAVKV